MRVCFRRSRQSFAGNEIDSRYMADECRSGKSKNASGEANDLGRVMA
jgi:hypothetical protein